ncbi:MAG: methionine--tRNA ligase [Patescibacteria group bacterium]|jgi:methionyl-tRNA synthetase|nr:methionine--tRNA ligase [Candidatus Magasanikbacteria bacterium]
MKNYYITTTLPYVNAEPHIGFALEIIQADVLARYHRLLGKNVVFNFGTDEHGLKIYRKALELGIEPQKYCDEYAVKFDALKQALNLSYTHFIRTTDKHHKKAAQEFWKLCEKNGDIYKKNYSVKYCVGCELEKTDSELVDGKCPVHPNLVLELIEEENYFFKFSKYQKSLLKLYKDNPNFIIPQNRQLEIKNFVERGLEDFSISRLKNKMPWGVEVPGDESQVMYVWFDALINYISTLGWPENKNNFEKNWPGVQVAGKDNLRQQAAMWQAMLISAGLPNSKQIFIHGFITAEGKKMSKSLGNVIEPYKIVEKYGTDAVRYYLLGAMPAYEDGDFSIQRFEEFYTAHLVNGIGNLTSRILTMLEKYSESKIPQVENGNWEIENFWIKYNKYLSEYKFEEVVNLINKFVAELDSFISTQKPWEKVKAGEDISGLLYQLAEGLRQIAVALLPIIPETAEKILKQLNTTELSHDWGKLSEGGIINKGGILFSRLENNI